MASKIKKIFLQVLELLKLLKPIFAYGKNL